MILNYYYHGVIHIIYMLLLNSLVKCNMVAIKRKRNQHVSNKE